ncbi:hypothetical protein BS17DRAFT_792003 [Gyrodon lividus]|nr:hypothetical protein BS17DRAFT_792003 [Gyrodon lividus]
MGQHLARLRRALSDVYAVNPALFVFTILAHLWYGNQDSLSLYLSNRLLFFVSPRRPSDVVSVSIQFRDWEENCQGPR